MSNRDHILDTDDFYDIGLSTLAEHVQKITSDAMLNDMGLPPYSIDAAEMISYTILSGCRMIAMAIEQKQATP